jgi:hypothetical protein
MNDEKEYEFFNLRKQAKAYISKVFAYDEVDPERVRHVRTVLEGNDQVLLGEIEGAMCLRLTGKARKTQVTATVTQDHKQLRRLSLQTFRPRAGDWIKTTDKDEFTFRGDEFNRLLTFLKRIDFIDFSNEENFQIEDISTKAGPKAIIDASDRGIVERFRVAFARACGAEGFRCERPEEVRPAIQAALRSSRPALVEAVVDPDEKPTDPDELRI